jgi:signal transduction histidine kinase
VPVLKWLLAFGLIFATGTFGFVLPQFGSSLHLPILPSGIAVAVTYRWGQRKWPAVCAAGIAIDLSTHNPLIAAIGVGLGLAGGAALTAWILERRGFDPSFSRARDVPLFVLAAAAGMTLAATVGTFGFYVADPNSSTVRATYWFRWLGNTMAGVLIVAPILVAVSRRSLAQFAEHWAEGVLWLIGIAIGCAAMFLPIDGQLMRPPVTISLLILVMVGTIRFGLVVTASGSFVILLAIAYGVAFDRGIFMHFSQFQGLIMIWAMSAGLTSAILVITALLAERDSASLERLRAEQRYAQIFNGSPQPIWVHDRDTLRILMINEAAVRQYGWSRKEILSMSVAALIAPGESRAPLDTDAQLDTEAQLDAEPQLYTETPLDTETPLEAAGQGAAAPALRVEPSEMRHLTRDGRVLEVEVWTRAIDFVGQPAELVFAVDVTERRAFGRALIDAIAGEQRRIGQEMHDGLGQELTGLALSVRALANRAERERDAIADDLDQLALLATSCIQDARLIVQGLSPLTDADGNLEAALEALARRSSLSGTPVRFRVRNEAPLDVDLKVRNHLYRIAQEAVQNALKHSDAHAIDIDLFVRHGSVRLEVFDDGHGLSAQDTRGTGLGMRTMRFRSSAIGGRLSMGRRAGGGNSIVCEAPQARAWPATERAAMSP